MIKIGVIGSAGYTAGELLRLLVYHPKARVVFVHSASSAGKKISDLHTDLAGESELTFTAQLDFEGIDVLFLCVGHGEAKTFLSAHPTIPDRLRIIDLSQDFRIASPEHDFVYGLTELNRDRIRSARHIANPGCFATAIQLAILPLAAAGALSDDVHIHAVTGSTGAGQKPTDTTHFSWRNNNISVYEVFQHRHLKEIGQSVRQLQPDFNRDLNFIPVRGNFARGIFATVYMKTDMPEETIQELYKDYYREAPFTRVADQNPHLKQVVNTNKAIVYVEKKDGKVFIVSMIDNLLKGASGQAVENMNLMFGVPQTEGLLLKALAF